MRAGLQTARVQRSAWHADSAHVPASQSFADVLESTLSAGVAPACAPRQWSSRPITPPLFVFGDTRLHVRAAAPVPVAAEPLTSFATGAPHVAPEPPPAADPTQSWFDDAPVIPAAARARARVLPALPPAARAALASLNALGAGLEALPSQASLRQAFRRLARQYHPDRHHAAGPREQQRLARLFAGATDHYRLLMAALDELTTRH
jgi:hypothetical protein